MLRLSMLFLFLVSCSHSAPRDTAQESQRFNEYLDKQFEEFLQLSPETAAYFGRKENTDKLNDRSQAFAEKMHEKDKKMLQEVQKFDVNALDEQARLSYELAVLSLQNDLSGYQWRYYGYDLTQQGGIHSDLPTFMINIHQVKTEKDLQDYISRLKEFPRAFKETSESIYLSEKAGVIPPRFVYPSIYGAMDNVLTGMPFQKGKVNSPLWDDFKNKMAKLKLPAAKQKEYLAQVEDVLKNQVKPAYEQLRTVVKDLETRATNDDGAWKFPRGSEFYNMRLARVTTTDLTAEQIHEMGLQNVARLRADMEKLKEKLKFKGTLQEFFKSVRKDAKQYYPQNEAGRKAYLQSSQKHLDQVMAKVPSYFRLLPKAKMVVKPVEKFREEAAGKAFYELPAEDGSRPGTYYVNLRNMKDAPKFEAEALLYHEGVPGHHFQIALAQEMKNLPQFRRYTHFTAYVEGWALYTERLAKEMGGYQNDYSELGRLTMEMTRACRLVVDSGIHAKQWTRQQAIDFMNANLPVNEGMVVEQIERYIVWPGQATGYMVGMLKIVELREKAKTALGERFDIRDFHDVVLGSGALPLGVLESRVDQYIQKKKTI